MPTAILIRPSGSTTIRKFKGYRDAMKLMGYGENDTLGYIHQGPAELTGAQQSSFLCRTAELETRKEYKPNPVASFLCGVNLVGPALLFGWDPTKTEIAAHDSVVNPGETMRFIKGTVRHLAMGVEATDDERRDCVRQAIGTLGSWRANAITVDELHTSQFIPNSAWDVLVHTATQEAARFAGPEPWNLFARGIHCSLALLGATTKRFVAPPSHFASLLEATDGDMVKARDCLLKCCELTGATLKAIENESPGDDGVETKFAEWGERVVGALAAGEGGTEDLLNAMDKTVKACPGPYADVLQGWSNALQSALTDWDTK